MKLSVSRRYKVRITIIKRALGYKTDYKQPFAGWKMVGTRFRYWRETNTETRQQ